MKRVAHLAEDHWHAMSPEWKSIKCSLCGESTGEGQPAITTHLARGKSLSALPADVESDDESGTEAAMWLGAFSRSQ
jgi:hypothetical protein